MSYEVRKVSDSDRNLSDGGRKVSDVVTKVLDGGPQQFAYTALAQFLLASS